MLFALSRVGFRADGVWQPRRAALLKEIIHLIKDTPCSMPHSPCRFTLPVSSFPQLLIIG